MTYSGEGKDMAAFRETTERNSGKMANAQYLTFRCKACGNSRPVSGRKSLGWKAGFQCSECFTAKSAA